MLGVPTRTFSAGVLRNTGKLGVGQKETGSSTPDDPEAGFIENYF